MLYDIRPIGVKYLLLRTLDTIAGNHKRDDFYLKKRGKNRLFHFLPFLCDTPTMIKIQIGNTKSNRSKPGAIADIQKLGTRLFALK